MLVELDEDSIDVFMLDKNSINAFVLDGDSIDVCVLDEDSTGACVGDSVHTCVFMETPRKRHFSLSEEDFPPRVIVSNKELQGSVSWMKPQKGRY